jgi:hypothetical protein
MQGFVMLSCRVQSAISQGFVCVSYNRLSQFDDLMTHAVQPTPPTHCVTLSGSMAYSNICPDSQNKEYDK